jgi:hypothetical protein
MAEYANFTLAYYNLELFKELANAGNNIAEALNAISAVEVPDNFNKVYRAVSGVAKASPSVVSGTKLGNRGGIAVEGVTELVDKVTGDVVSYAVKYMPEFGEPKFTQKFFEPETDKLLIKSVKEKLAIQDYVAQRSTALINRMGKEGKTGKELFVKYFKRNFPAETVKLEEYIIKISNWPEMYAG